MARTVVADTTALAAAAAGEFLDLLPGHFGRIILSPTVVDELVEIEVIDALVAGAVEHIIEVVSLTEEEAALAGRLSEAIAARSADGDAAVHRGEAEALAIMQRSELEAELFLCDDMAALQIAGEAGIPTTTFLTVVRGAVGEAAAEQLAAAPRLHEPEEPALPATEPPPDRTQPREATVTALPAGEVSGTIEIDDETAALLQVMVEQGVGRDPAEVVARAVRGLATALDL